MRPLQNSSSSRNCAISAMAGKDDEAVYGQYTARRTDEVRAEMAQLQQEREFCNGLYMPHAFDLQIQSTASDGKHTPADIVAMAREEDVAVIAMTDHDTVGGVAGALVAGAAQGVRVIAGIEMSVEERGAHILGYGIDYGNARLLDALEQSKQGRVQGAKKITENLKAAGFAIEWQDVIRQVTGDVVARPHIARAVLSRSENQEKLGGIATSHEFIEKYLTDESPYYVRRSHISAEDAIALIRGAGGVAVWSHPAVHFPGDEEGLETFLKSLVAWGIEGLEVFSPAHTEDDVELLHALAGTYGLLRTGGSDFHEKGNHLPDERGLYAARAIGDFETYGFPTDEMVPELDEAVAGRKIASS